MQVTSGGTTTSYTVDTSLPYASVVVEYSGSTLSARYDYGDDLVRMDRGGGVYYYIYDGLGSTRQLVNTVGAVTDSYGYSAFGEMASHTGSTTNGFLFNTQQFDGASGDYFLRARYYDQSNGRFIKQDPAHVGINQYIYCDNDPVNKADPLGLDGDLISLSVEIPTSEAIEGEEAPVLVRSLAQSSEKLADLEKVANSVERVEVELDNINEESQFLERVGDIARRLGRDPGKWRKAYIKLFDQGGNPIAKVHSFADIEKKVIVRLLNFTQQDAGLGFDSAYETPYIESFQDLDQLAGLIDFGL